MGDFFLIFNIATFFTFRKELVSAQKGYEYEAKAQDPINWVSRNYTKLEMSIKC